MGKWSTLPKLRTDLTVSEQESDGQKYVIIKDPITARYFRLREPEYYLIRQFDGQSSFPNIVQRFKDKFDLTITAGAVEKFAEKIDSLCFFEGSKAEYEVSSSRYRGQKHKTLLTRLLFIKLKAFNPDRLLKQMIPPLRFLFTPIGVSFMTVFMLLGAYIYSANFAYFRFDPTRLYHFSSLLTIFISLSLIIFAHEFAHALTCRYFGGNVREMGFLLLYFQPCFYANLSDSWMFERKSSRLAVIWAGLFFQMVIFALAVLGWRITVIGTFPNNVFWLVANTCFLTLLFNINPLIKLDGYYLLSELVNIPNLRSRSFGYFNWLVKKILGVTEEKLLATPREKRVYWFYTILAGLYSAFLIIYVAVLVYRFLVGGLGGTGFILFLCFVILIIKEPFIRTFRFLTSREVMTKFASKPRRLTIGIIVLVLVILLVFVIPFNRRVGGDIVIRPLAEYTITIQSQQGLLELNYRQGGTTPSYNTEHILLSSGDLSVLQLTPRVNEGDNIHKGETLAVILSNQVSSNLNAAKAELERLRGELALAQSPPKPEEVATSSAAADAARAAYEQKQKDLERQRSLYDKKLISKQEYEKFESDLDIARSTWEESEARLKLLKSPPKPEEVAIIKSKIATQEANISYLLSQAAAQVIVSPIDGEVVALYRGQLLFKVAAMAQVEAAIPVTDNFLEYIKSGAAIRLKVRTFPGRTFNGVVTHISRSANDAAYNDNRARFDVFASMDNKDRLLQDGMSGYAKVFSGKASLFTLAAEKVRSFIRVEFWSWW